MNALELLKNDHEKISGILEKLDQTTERALKTRDEQFARLKEEIEDHSHIEETVFYPALSDDARTRTMTLEALEEHRVVKNQLDEISGIAVDTEEWTAKFKVLKAAVDQHVKVEEGELFKQARQVLTKARLDELGEEMEAARGEEPVPALTGRAAGQGERSRSARSGATRPSRSSQRSGFSFGVTLVCPSLFNRFCR
jgi:hemerythrin-like domain-containing protein